MNVWPVLLPICLQEDNCSSGDTERRDRHLLSESRDNFFEQFLEVYSFDGEKGGVGGGFISITLPSV